MAIPQDEKGWKPRTLAVTGGELAVAWGDGHESYLPFDALRRACPCAMCRARTTEATDAGPLRVVTGPAKGGVSIRNLVPVGSYAVQIVWSDGHDTGIHSFESLRRACPCEDCAT